MVLSLHRPLYIKKFYFLMHTYCVHLPIQSHSLNWSAGTHLTRSPIIHTRLTNFSTCSSQMYLLIYSTRFQFRKVNSKLLKNYSNYNNYAENLITHIWQACRWSFFSFWLEVHPGPCDGKKGNKTSHNLYTLWHSLSHLYILQHSTENIRKV